MAKHRHRKPPPKKIRDYILNSMLSALRWILDRLENAEIWLLNKKYPYPSKTSKIVEMFIASYEEKITEIFSRRGPKLSQKNENR